MVLPFVGIGSIAGVPPKHDQIGQDNRMGIFSRATPEPERIKAQAATSNAGRMMLDNFATYTQGEYRARAMSVPVVTRGRDLICGTIGNLRLEAYRWMWNGDEMERVPQAPRSWLGRIDKGVPNSVILSWTADDLLFYGRAFWFVTERTADGYPSSFTRMPANMVSTEDQAGPVWFGPSKQIYFNGAYVDWQNVVQFISPNQGLIYTTPKSIETAIKLEQSRYRSALTSIPSVILAQKGGEPLSGQELADLAAAFDKARVNNQTAAVNEFIEVKETYATPDKMMLIESADYQARDLCRSLGIPPYLAGIATGSYSYSNSQSARQDLYVFGMAPIITCIEETLSADNVLPHGTGVRFDIDDYLSLMYGNDEIEPIPGAPAQNTQEELA